ncbi:MAG: hypothetical protein ACREGB_05440 [Candidatus Saccharimonadales bacterium]
MQDDQKPTEPAQNSAPDTEILQQISEEQVAKAAAAPTTPTEPEAIDKPQLGPVVLGGRKSHKKLWLSLVLLILLAAIGSILYSHFVLNKSV